MQFKALLEAIDLNEQYCMKDFIWLQVIGRLELGAEGAGSARHHWREVQAAPRRQIADWHKLKE